MTTARALATVRRWGPSAAVVLVIVRALVWVVPRAPRSPFVETVVWSLLVLVSFVGWGSLVAWLVAREERVDLGLRAAWGAALLVFAGGVLVVPSAMTHTPALVMVEGGVALACLAAIRERRRVSSRLLVAARLTRREPGLALVVVLVVALLAVHYVAGIAEWHQDPYDDHVAYLAFVKKLLQTGSFPEPFSFRRLSSLGGQTFLGALVAVRSYPVYSHAFDRSICVAMCVLLVAGHRRRGRRLSFVFLALGALFVPLLPLVARNTAANYSAIAFFVALFRTVLWAADREERAAWRNALPVALVSAAACTLRQNYIPVLAVFLAASYGLRALRMPGWRLRLVEPAVACAGLIAFITPWMIAAWQSNQTPLYPLALGTFNKALVLQNRDVTLAGELRVLFSTVVEGVPLRTLPLFVLVALFIPEKEPRRPLLSFTLAAGIGLVLLVHAINTGDPDNLGRYAWGSLVALAVAAILAAGLVRLKGSLGRPQLAALVALVALALSLVRAGDSLHRYYARAFRNLDLALIAPPPSDDTRRWEQRVTRTLQDTVPAGARLAVLLDDPFYLDFARNPVWNLDMPGYSSLAPGMPFFRGSQALEDYFRAIGIRYVAFVRSDQSTYQYRRDYWLKLLFDEMDIWRSFAPYVIDLTDNLLALAERHRRLFDADGNVVLDLAEAP